MRRSLALMAVLLVGCSNSGADEPTPSPSPSASTAAASPSSSPEPSKLPMPPVVEGAWEATNLLSMTSVEEIQAAALPEGLKKYLIDTLEQEILANDEYAEEFPDCLVTVEVTALHPAGFAVGQVMGCGPTGHMGVFKDDGGVWRDAAMVAEGVPACQALADEGIPGKVPVPWDEGLRCSDGENSWRYW